MNIFKSIFSFLTKERGKKGVVITYHYITSRKDVFWGKLKGINVGQFINQLNYFKENNYKFISLSDYVDFLYGKGDAPDNFCVLTFDDGLKEHYLNVFPILKERGLKGCFFPLPKAFEGVISSTHKIHILLAELDDRKLAQEVNECLKFFSPENFEKFKIDDAPKTGLDRQKRMDIKYKMDGALRTNLKYNLAVMDENLKNTILDTIFKKYFADERSLAQEFYLSKAQIQEMSEDGMEFGAHTITHPRLATLSNEEQKSEIDESKEMLENILAKKVDIFSYPYGSYNLATMEILKNLGFRAAVTIKAHFNVGKVDPFQIRRFDTKDFPI